MNIYIYIQDVSACMYTPKVYPLTSIQSYTNAYPNILVCFMLWNRTQYSYSFIVNMYYCVSYLNRLF